MLSSIHPLGERARNNRWGFTVVSYVLGSAAAGALLGAILGSIGYALVSVLHLSGRWALPLVAFAGIFGAVLDLGWARLGVPSLWPRQVNDRWLTTYRGWVYGAGFGFQLGLGMATFVTTAAVYATWLVALLSASPSTGLVIGAAFGIARAATVFAVARVHDPAGLRRAHGRLQALVVPARRLTAAAQAGLAAFLIAGALL